MIFFHAISRVITIFRVQNFSFPIRKKKRYNKFNFLQVVVLEDNEADKNDVLRHNRGGDRQYVYDAVFGEDSSQEQVYEKTTKGLVKDVIEGYNATVFAYGATGSGKTYTMLGSSLQPGIMVRALNELFNIVKENKSPQHFNVSFNRGGRRGGGEILPVEFQI